MNVKENTFDCKLAVDLGVGFEYKGRSESLERKNES